MNIQIKIRERVNVMLPKNTLRLINKTTEKGGRSRFINEAICYYIKKTKQADIKKYLKEGAIENSKRDVSLTNDWFALEDKI
jgi:CopG family transcriptional regulator / antitoxin EndoAI